MRFEYVVADCLDPYSNLAFEHALLGMVGKEDDAGHAVLYFWQNAHTIVIGKNQDLYAECLADEFVRSGGRIARRHSGGGAVYHDIGNLNYSFISHVGRGMESMRPYYYEVVMAAVAEFGIEPGFNGRNDLTAGGRKFSGNAAYVMGHAACWHGTVLVRADIGKMDYFLTPSGEKLCRNRVDSVAARVVNLSEFNPEIEVTDLRRAMVEITGAVPMEDFPDLLEVGRLRGIYAGDNWIYRRNFE